MPIIWVGRSMFGLSRLLVGRAISVVRKKKPRPRPVLSFPVAGIGELDAQSVSYALTQATHDEEDDEVSRLWLKTLQLTQAMSDRLLQDLLLINESLRYWKNSMAQGSHFLKMFLRNGPIMFYKKMKELIQGEENEEKSATDMIEARVLILRNLDELVSGALGKVQEIADQLRLRQQDQDIGASTSVESHQQGERELINSARIAIRKACETLVEVVESLQEDSKVFSEFSEAKSQLKKIAVEQTRTGLARLPSKTEKDMQVPKTQDTSSGVPDLATLRACILKVENLLEAGLEENSKKTANNALAESALVVAESPPIVVVPKWARCPSRLEQKWLEYTIGGAIGIWCFGWIICHSPLVGSPAMYNWANAIKFAFGTHVLGPLKALRGKLFHTFRSTPSIVSRAEYDVSSASLRRMLQDFEKDHRSTVQRLPPLSDGTVAVGEIAGMITLMRVYEHELKNPIWNVVTGGLARALLVQVQKLKTDVEAAMLQLDSILSANELNVAMIAAIPSVLIAGGLVYLLMNWIRNSGPDPFVSATPCRLNLVELERTFSKYEKAQLTPRAEGVIFHNLYKVYACCWEVFKNRDRTSSESEWPSMRRDMVDLSRRDIPIKQKLKICGRMRATYTVFQLPRK